MDIHQEIDHLMAGIELELSQPTLEERLRSFLAMMEGDEAWRACAVMGNTTIDGTTVYAAFLLKETGGGSVAVRDRRFAWLPQRAMQVRLVTRDDLGQFQMASYWPVEGNQEDL